MKKPDFQKGEYITCPNHNKPGFMCFERVHLLLSADQSKPDRAVFGHCWGNGDDDDMTCGTSFHYSIEEAENLVLKQWKEDEERQLLSDQRDQALKEARCNTPCPSCGNLCWEMSEEKRKEVLEKYPYPKRS